MATDNLEDGAGRRTPGRRTPPRLPGMDFLAKLGDRVNFLEASMEQIKLGEEPLEQQLSLREKILDQVKSTAMEALSHSFNRQAAQLHTRMTNLHESVLASLEKGIHEAEGRLEGRFAEMCAQANRGGVSAEGAEITFTSELRGMLEVVAADQQRELSSSPAKVKRRKGENKIVRQGEASRSPPRRAQENFQESRSPPRTAPESFQELEQLRAEVEMLRLSDAARQARLNEVVVAFGESLQEEREARELRDAELRGAVSALQAGAQQASSSDQGIQAPMAEDGRRLDSAFELAAAEESVRQACDTAARAIISCQELATQLESERSQRAFEVTRLRTELQDTASALREAMPSLARRRPDELGETVRCEGSELGEAMRRDGSLPVLHVDVKEESDTDIGVEMSALRAEMDALAQIVCEFRPRPEAESAELQAREEMAASLREEMSTTLREELRGAEERSLVVTGALQEEFSSLRELVKAWKPEPPPAADAPSREGGTGEVTTPTGAGELARELVAAEQQARSAAIAEVQKEVAALQESLCHLKPDAPSGEAGEATATGGPAAEALELAAGLKAETEARCSSIQELREELSAERIAGFVQQAAEEASERLEARASDVAAALEGSAEQQCAKLGEVISELVESAEKRLEEKLSSCAGAGASPGAGAQAGDLDALLQRVEAQEKEHATGLQELGELFLGELAGLRASSDEQCQLLLQELQGERETRSREFTEFREALCSLTAA